MGGGGREVAPEKMVKAEAKGGRHGFARFSSRSPEGFGSEWKGKGRKDYQLEILKQEKEILAVGF